MALGTLIAGPAAAQTLPPVGSIDQARVLTIVASIPMAVDLGRFELAESAFAPSVVIDYTSLWGGTPQTMTPAQLMAAWRGIVPGFDATWHEISKLESKIDGDRATATAHVDGRHWIADRLWRPIGEYRWELARAANGWQVTRMTFAMSQEIGERALAREATERAKTLR